MSDFKYQQKLKWTHAAIVAAWFRADVDRYTFLTYVNHVNGERYIRYRTRRNNCWFAKESLFEADNDEERQEPQSPQQQESSESQTGNETNEECFWSPYERLFYNAGWRTFMFTPPANYNPFPSTNP